MSTQDILSQYSPTQIMSALQREQYRRHYQKFAEEQLKIAPKYVAETGLVPFKFNRAQQQMNNLVTQQMREEGWIRLCLLKHRQPGGSTWAAGRGYQLTALTPHTHAMIFAQDDPTSDHILDIVRRFHDNLAPAYRPRIHQRPANGLVFQDPASPPGKHKERRIGSSIRCQTARTALSGTGRTLQFVQLSECAKYAYPVELWTSLSPAIPDMPGTTVILESTAHHSGAWFRDRYEQAKHDPDSPFRALFTPWYLSDEYQLALKPGERLVYSLEEKQRREQHGLTPQQIKWYRYKMASLGGDDLAAQLMKQEYPETDDEAWVDLSAGVFDARKLFGYLQAGIRPPVKRGDLMPGPRFLDNPQGGLAIWEAPQVEEMYDIGADVATGQEGGAFDWSVASIVKRRNREQVAEWRGQIDVMDFGHLLFQLGLYYNQAQVAVETSGIGFSTNEQLHKLGYPRIYIWRTRGEAVPRLTKHSGWRTSNESKNYLVSLTRHFLMNEEITVHSDVLWNEMKTYATQVSDSGLITYGATGGFNDDTVMAFMIALVIGDDERIEFEEPPPQDPKPFIDPGLVDSYRWVDHEADTDGLGRIADQLVRESS